VVLCFLPWWSRGRRNFLSTEDFTRAEITGILDLAVRGLLVPSLPLAPLAAVLPDSFGVSPPRACRHVIAVLARSPSGLGRGPRRGYALVVFFAPGYSVWRPCGCSAEMPA
jgi:hypothetical protein